MYLDLEPRCIWVSDILIKVIALPEPIILNSSHLLPLLQVLCMPYNDVTTHIFLLIRLLHMAHIP